MWLYRKKSIGVMSGDLGGQALARFFQSSNRCRLRSDVDSEEDLISLFVEAAATWHF